VVGFMRHSVGHGVQPQDEGPGGKENKGQQDYRTDKQRIGLSRSGNE